MTTTTPAEFLAAEFARYLAATQGEPGCPLTAAQVADLDPVTVACLWSDFRETSDNPDQFAPGFLSNVPADVVHFASGSNHRGEILGFARAGLDLGVAVQELDNAGQAEHALRSLAGSTVRVFVDSGAFSEIAFTASGPVVAKPIADGEWLERLATYRRLAVALGAQLFAVAPDMVAFQDGTLRRQATHAAAVRDLVQKGANVIVPVQKGSIPMAEFFALELRALGLEASQVVAGIPCKKDATSPADLAEFCRVAQPARVHLLGIGPQSRGARFAQLVAAVRENTPGCEVYCDSVRIAAMVGRDGKGGKARPLTAKRDELLAAGALEADAAGCKEAMIAAHFLAAQVGGISQFEREFVAQLEPVREARWHVARFAA